MSMCISVIHNSGATFMRRYPTKINGQYLVVLWIQLHTLHAVCVCIAVHLQLEAGHGTVGSNQCHLLLHVVLAAIVQSLEVFSQSFGVLALLEEVVALLLQLIKQELKMERN